MFFCLSNKNKLSRLNLDLIRLTLDLTVSMRLSFLKRAIHGLFLFILKQQLNFTTNNFENLSINHLGSIRWWDSN